MQQERLLFSAHPASMEKIHALALGRDTFLRGDIPHVRQTVIQPWNWARAVGVNPEIKEFRVVRPDAPAVDDVSEELLRIGSPVVATAGEFLRGTNYGVILTDASGVILDFAGDRLLARAAERIGAVPGASLEERFAGNNAIGTSLRLGRAVHFNHAEHFCDALTDWTCAATPIRMPSSGTIIGSIDVSSYRTIARPQQAMALATRLGRVIEDVLERSRRVRTAAQRGVRDPTASTVTPHSESRPSDRLLDLRTSSPLVSDLLAARRNERKILVHAEQVYLVVAEGPVLHALTDQDNLLVDADSLSALEARLAGYGFFRTDRAHLVNLYRVQEIQSMFNRTLVLVLGDRRHTEVPVARRRAEELLQLFGL